MTGPRQSMSASMARAFRVSDRLKLNLRIDAPNPLNHVVVTQLNTTMDQSAVRLAGRRERHAQRNHQLEGHVLMRCFCWLMLPLVAIGQVQSQVQSQVQPATTGATFTTSTQLIVEGLKKEDFLVTEDGKPQTITFFDFEDIDRLAE
jgi:hypothetical protein